MKHALTLLLALFMLTACHDEPAKPRRQWKHVVVVYVMGENSLSTFAQRDLNEMRRALRLIPDSCQLAVCFDNSRADERPKILSLSRNEGEQPLFTYSNDPIATDSATLAQALNIVMRELPADHYSLVMWSHGSGWLPQTPRYTIGVDNGRNSLSDTGMEMEVRTLAHVLQQTGRKWDYVLFDACFMQSVETAYELRSATEWCMGSPAEIPGEGAPYDVLMPTLFSPVEEAWHIARQYHEYYDKQGGVVISAIRCSELEPLAQATAPIIRQLPKFPPTDGIQRYFALDYEGQWLPEFFDMGSAMHKWLGEDDYLTWLTAARRAVPHCYASSAWYTGYDFVTPVLTDADHVLGMSMYVPVENDQLLKSFTQTRWNQAIRWTSY